MTHIKTCNGRIVTEASSELCRDSATVITRLSADTRIPVRTHVFLVQFLIWGQACVWIHTVVLIKFLPYSGATAETRSAALWGVSGSYGQAPAQQGMSGLVRETSHLWLYSSPSPSLQPILREPATSILIVLDTFVCIMWVATESLWKYVQGNK